MLQTLLPLLLPVVLGMPHATVAMRPLCIRNVCKNPQSMLKTGITKVEQAHHALEPICTAKSDAYIAVIQ